LSFFVSTENIADDIITFTPDDSKHLALVLRTRIGQHLTVCDDNSMKHECIVSNVKKDLVQAKIISSVPFSNQPSAEVTVFAALSKGDRFDYTVQKCVECGAFAIVPFISDRCIARPDKSEYAKKQMRYQKIADEAVRQSGRSQKVTVGSILSFDEMLEKAALHKTTLFLYENENMLSLSSVLSSSDKTDYSLITGPEGGFSDSEVSSAKSHGIPIVSIGPRIMRCETAPVAALCSIMFFTGNFDIGA
jgi:16S rRNA (uracil1498-N3)-methyltransferase